MDLRVQTWEEWGRVFTDVAVWRPIVEEICGRHGLGRAPEIVAGYPGSNAVFEVGGSLIVKIAAPFWREDFELERELYPLLTAETDLPTPCLLARGVLTAGQQWPYFMFAWTLLHRFSNMRPYLERLGGPERMRSLEEFQKDLWRV